MCAGICDREMVGPSRTCGVGVKGPDVKDGSSQELFRYSVQDVHTLNDTQTHSDAEE